MSQGIEFLNTLAYNLRRQDNAYTSYPIYEVQEAILIAGLDTAYTETIGWFHTDNFMADEAEAAELEAEFEKTGDEPPDWTRTGYDHRFQQVQSFLTLSAAEDYIKTNSHRHKGDLRVYVESAYRNTEWKELRRMLSGPVQDCIGALQAMLDEDDGGREAAKARAALASLDAYKDPCA